MERWDHLESQVQSVNLAHPGSPERLGQRETWELLERREASVSKVQEENLESLEYLESLERWVRLERMEAMERKVDRDPLVHQDLPDSLDQEVSLV